MMRAWWMLVLALTAPMVHADSSVTRELFQVTSKVLPNGLHVIRHHRDISDTFTAQLVVDVGLQDFDCDEQQLPHLLEHMLFEGTTRFDRQALRQRVRDHGGKHNGFTTEEYTHYTLELHSDYPEIALENLHSMMTESLFLPEHVESSRQVIHAEQGTSSNMLHQAASGKKDLHRMAKARVYGGSLLECPDYTTPDGISLQRLKDVFGQYYVASNMSLLIIGHFDDARIDQALENTLAKLPAAPRPTRTPIRFSAMDADPVVAQKSLMDPEVDMALYVRIPGTTHPDFAAFDIAAEYLGEKLFYTVRGEKGLAYTPHAYTDSNSQFGFLRAATKTLDQFHDQVAELFHTTYQQLRHDGIPAADVERLRHKLILEFESKQRDNNELAQTYRHFRHIIRDRGSMPDLVEQLQQMDAARVNATLRNHLPLEPLLVSARPPSFGEALLRMLPATLVLGAVGVLLLRWSHRRRLRQIR